MAELNFVERVGLEFLRRRIDREEPHFHKWTAAELAAIERIERRTKVVAAIAGAISGGVLGVVEIWLGGEALERTDAALWRQQLPYWLAYGGLAILVSGAEVLYLYGYVLRAVARIGSIAGLSLTAREVELLVARGLSRAALEIPNPRQPIHGIDPYARVPRWKLAAFAIFYRMKVGVTSFILRILLRRVLSRAAVRVFIPLVAIPVFALWNALVARWIMREVRVRVAGPLAVQQLGALMAADGAGLDKDARQLIIAAVGEAILRGEDAHPNYALLVARLLEDLAVPPESIRIDWDARRGAVKKLDARAQDLLLTTLTVAALLNSRLKRAQRELLAEAFSLCGRSFRPQMVLDLRREFIRGQGIGEEKLGRLVLG